MSDGASTPLCDLRVVEVSDRIAGAYCGKLFVDAGADVVKVEPAAGDPLRRFTATGARPAAGADSPLFSYLVRREAQRDNGFRGPVGRGRYRDRDREPARCRRAWRRSGAAAGGQAGMRGRDHLRLRLDGAVVGAARYRVHPAGRIQGSPASAAIPRARPISIGGDLGEYMGAAWAAYGAMALRRRVRTRRPWWAPRLVDARGDHADAEQRMAALAATAEATRQALGRGAVDRARQGRLRRHQHGHRPTVAGLRGDGRLPRLHRDSAAALPDRAMGLPRLDSGTDRPVDAREDRRRDRRARTALPVAAGSARQRFDDPGDGSPAGAWRVHRQPRGIPATARAMADVGRQPGAGAPRSRGRGSRRRSPSGSQGNRSLAQSPRCAPLAGVRVVDFTAFWAGPAATHSLAAFGADVIKIESIQRPDGIRYSGGMRTDVDDWWEYGWVFHAMNTNKRSVTLDLQSDRRSPTWSRNWCARPMW